MQGDMGEIYREMQGRYFDALVAQVNGALAPADELPDLYLYLPISPHISLTTTLHLPHPYPISPSPLPSPIP